MALRRIKHLFFTYSVEEDSPYEIDKKILVEKIAYRDQEVDIPREQDVLRGEKFDAFYTEADSLVETESGEEVPVSALDDEELVAWIRDDNPTAKEVVDAANDNPDQAVRLLAAENAATGNDPRKSVAEPLQKIIDGGSNPPPNN